MIAYFLVNSTLVVIAIEILYVLMMTMMIMSELFADCTFRKERV